jgi:uncharacterized protein DUF4159
MLKARCPSCGKSAALNETDAGLPVVCLACGARFTAPDLFLAGEGAEPGGAATAASRISNRPRVGRTFWVALGLGGLAGVAALILVLNSLPDPIDRATALSLASEAKAHADAGRLADAHRKYHELETIVGTRTVHDPEIRQVVDQAMADKQRVYTQLLAQVDKDRQAAATAPSAAPATAPAATTAPATSQPRRLAGANEQRRDEQRPAPLASAAPVNPIPATAPAAAASSDPPADPVAATQRTEVATASPINTAPPPASAVSPPSPAGSQTAPAIAAATARVPGPSTPSTQPAVGAPLLPRPPIRPMPAAADDITDEQIGRAIQKGVNHLLARFDSRSHTLNGVDTGAADGGGQNALAVYALMQCGQAINDERLNVRGQQMDAMIEAMKESRLRRGHPQTYATGIRATALSLFNRPQDRAVLRQDVAALVLAHTQGSYTYEIDPARNKQRYKGVWDNSNSQYGLLGVWAGAEAGLEVPGAYWAAVEQHWVETQLPDGQWSYGGERGGRVSMSAAGIASLFVTHDYLDAPKYGRVVGREPFSPALQRGLDWFEHDDNSVTLGSHFWGYTLYGIERVGLASGFKYFGNHDWYRKLAADVVASQAADGSWGDTVDTSFALLFLARGRHPVLMNKVRFHGHWANRPRDVANLSRFAARQLERELNWQVVPLRPAKAWTDWLDSPILYIASHQPPKLLEQDYDNLRQFVAAGGLLFIHADGDDAGFNRWAGELAARLFPRYEMRDLPADHAVFNLVYKIDDDERPPLKAVSNGARLLMVHSPVDVARAWQLRETRLRKGAFQLGINLFLYASGRRDLRNRLDSTYVSDPGQPVNGSVTVARIEYPGNWDPEPAAWPRFARWFQRQTGTGLNLSVVKLSALRPGEAPIAHLTGTARYDFSAEEAALVKAYVEAGGVLLVDQCGGTGPFDQSALDNLLGKAFAGVAPVPLDPLGHPLFRATGPTSGMDDLTKPRLRQFSVQGRVNESMPLSGFAFGKGHVIYTPIDITSGLLGSRTWGIAGLHPDYAPAFVKNLLFWTLDGQPDK